MVRLLSSPTQGEEAATGCGGKAGWLLTEAQMGLFP